MTPSTQERFDAKWSPEPNTGCHLWLSAQDPKGYGKFTHQGREVGAHRAAWQLAHGPIPSGMFVCHRCDTPLCVNAAHLFLGTPRDNSRDCKAKGRTPTGERCGLSKLTEVQVIELRRLEAIGASQTSLARLIGVDQTTVSAALRGRTWRHLRDPPPRSSSR